MESITAEAVYRSGDTLLFSRPAPEGGSNLVALDLRGRSERVLVRSRQLGFGARFSPDGHWLAYASDESGRLQVYVTDFPGRIRKEQVSTEGGAEAVWSRDGQELFYRNGDKMMAVAIVLQPTFHALKPEFLFEKYHVPYAPLRNYDVSSDGRHFLMLKDNEQFAATTHIDLVLNWHEELKRRVPTR